MRCVLGRSWLEKIAILGLQTSGFAKIGFRTCAVVEETLPSSRDRKKAPKTCKAGARELNSRERKCSS